MTNTTTDVVNNTQTETISESSITFTLHLPGLNKTVQMSYDKPITNCSESQVFHDFITTSFGVVPRRAQIFLIHMEKGPIKLFMLPYYGITISNGDKLILCVRGTTVPGQNEYYETQKESLRQNTYLNPPLSKDDAKSLLISIAGDFEMYGHRYYFPGGQWYEYGKKLAVELAPYYDT